MDELFYKHTMVHPELDNDPVGRQGNIGRISHIIYENDEVYVRFPNDLYGLYETAALLVLRPWEQLLESLRESVESLERRDILDLLNIYLLQASGQPEALEEALKLALMNTTIRDRALIPLRDWIDNGLSDDRNHGADWQPGR